MAMQLEYRHPTDEAWRVVRLVKLEAGKMVISYVDDEEAERADDTYTFDQFTTSDELDDWRRRFRLLSQPLRASDCGMLYEGKVVLVPTCESSLYYDAKIRGASRSQHKMLMGYPDEKCNCTFHVTYTQGPCTGCNDNVPIDHIYEIEEGEFSQPVLHDFIVTTEQLLSIEDEGETNSLHDQFEELQDQMKDLCQAVKEGFAAVGIQIEDVKRSHDQSMARLLERFDNFMS